jgi:dTDP-4-dehydrorhamnose reductase
MKRALVTGAGGLLGQHLVSRLKSSYNVTAIDIAPDVFEIHKNVTFIKRDLTEPGAVSDMISDFSPDAVYNCAAFTDVDRCEIDRESAYKLNVALVEDLIAAGAGRIVHFSSDYVFNGRSGPYAEVDRTDPLGYYGRTKLESEEIILNSPGGHLIIRTNVLFGAGIDIRLNFIMWLIRSLSRGESLKIATDQYNNPIHADNLADAAIEAEENGINGILHIGGASYLSRYEMAVATAARFGFDKSLIHPVKTAELGQTARRPMRGGLKIDLAKRLLNCRLLEFEEGLRLI